VGGSSASLQTGCRPRPLLSGSFEAALAVRGRDSGNVAALTVGGVDGVAVGAHQIAGRILADTFGTELEVAAVLGSAAPLLFDLNCRRGVLDMNLEEVAPDEQIGVFADHVDQLVERRRFDSGFKERPTAGPLATELAENQRPEAGQADVMGVCPGVAMIGANLTEQAPPGLHVG